MKKLFAALTFYALLFNSLTSCNNSGNSTEAYTLRMRLQPGDRFKQNTEMNMDMGMMGMLINMKMNIGANFEVLTSDSANKSLKITYTKMDMKMDKNMPNSAELNKMINEKQQSIIGKSVTTTLDKGNKIIAVEGFDQLFSDSLSGPSGEALKKMFDKDNLNSIFGMWLRMYPEKPVKAGDSWNGTTDMDLSGMKMSIDNKYTLQSVKDGLANIGVDGKLNNKGNMEQGGMKMDMTMSGTYTGTMQVKLADGYITKGDYKMDIKGEIAMMGQKIPMTMKADGTMKGQ